MLSQLRRAPWTMAVLAYLGLSVALLLPAWQDPTHVAAGVPGDPVFFQWILAWVPAAIAHGHNPLISGFMYHPVGINLMWNTSFTLPAALMSPVTVLGGPILAWNVLLTLALASSAAAAYCAASRITGSAAGAFVAGLIYGFSPYMVGQSFGHVFLVVAVFPPLVLLLLHEGVGTGRWSNPRTGAALGVLAAAQVLVSLEVLATTALLAAAGLVVLALLNRADLRQGAYRLAVAAGAALLVALPLAAFPLYTMFAGPQRIRGQFHAGGVWIADLANFFTPTALQAVTPSPPFDVSQTGLVETTAFLGTPLILLLAVTIFLLRRDRTVRWLGIMGAFAACCALGEHLHWQLRDTGIPLPWLVFAHVPLLQDALPIRITLYVFLAAGLLVAALIAHAQREGSTRLQWISIVGVAAIAVTLFPKLPFPSTPHRVPAYFSDGRTSSIAPGSVALLLPMPNPGLRFPNANHNESLLWQADTGVRFRIFGGYGFIPDPAGNGTLEPPASALTDRVLSLQAGSNVSLPDASEQERLRAELRELGVSTVIVAPMKYQANAVQFFRLVLQRPPVRQPGGVLTWEGLPGA